MSDLPQRNTDLAEAASGFLRFFTESAWAMRTEPGADFVAGNPQELPLQAFTIVELPGYFRVSVTASDEMIDRALPVFAAAMEESR